ncbi:MAG TPA: hypothetical protein VKS80_16675 [Trinickia sp.]|nr:hypothetical protein [Trinickia sp.]
MRLLVAVALALSTLGATASARSDPMTSLRFLVGDWTCAYHQGAAKVTYKATFAYDLAGNWLRERDVWTGGGGDEALFTYQPKRHAWIAVVVEQERNVALFKGTGSDFAHIVYNSVYPETTMSQHFERTSPTKYSVFFSQTTNGKTVKSTDVCTRV